MKTHCANARQVAEFLRAHPKVSAVHYPRAGRQRLHAVAKKQMSGFGGMLSFEVHGGKDAAMAVAAKVDIFTRATSLGGVESPDRASGVHPKGQRARHRKGCCACRWGWSTRTIWWMT